MRTGRTIEFQQALHEANIESPVKGTVTTVQVNLGKRCNQACRHCHVGAGPGRNEMMSNEVARRVIDLVQGSSNVEVVDLTGGAPELNQSFPWLVESIRDMGRRVIDRCNLTVLGLDGMEHMADFLAENKVEIVASLPCYTQENVDSQRGVGAFEQSIAALRRLNRLGYGVPGSGLTLDLVYNPGSAMLPGPQNALQSAYKDELAKGYDVCFNRLLTMVNMPICRFNDQLEETGHQDVYMQLLRDSFNPATVPGLMCLSLVSIAWNGEMFDCDFHQMEHVPLRLGAEDRCINVFDLSSLKELEGRPITTAAHCFGCTAGAGSSCQGALQ